MDTDSSGFEATTPEEAVPSKAGRPPPIILTSNVNLIQFQRQLRKVATGDFESHSTKNVTRVINKGIADIEAVKSHLSNNTPSYYFFPKPQTPIKAIICQLTPKIPAENTSDGMVTLGFYVVSIKQMTTTRGSPSEEMTTRNLPLFLITILRTAKSQDNFKLESLCHISIQFEAYRAQSALTQCQNCQQFGHIWAKCKQLPAVCGAGAVTCKKSAQKN
jgi:hypothetical protein